MMFYYKRALFSLIVFLLTATLLSGQNSKQLSLADSLHNTYHFQEAIDLYQSILDNTTDSLLHISIQEKMVECENGINLLKYTSSISVTDKKVFSIKDFYLYLPDFSDRTWIPIPNVLVSELSNAYYSAACFPFDATELYFSAPDNSGSWNIYYTELIGGNLWSQPRLLSEALTSAGDEIFPVLSSNGKELYFASNGHFGMGGFDLYVSRWDDETEEWGTPENLGFPYSSTSDDIFIMNTSDGQHTIIASNRGISKDSVALYVIDYVPTPIKQSLDEIAVVQKEALLLPDYHKEKENSKLSVSSQIEDDSMKQYSQLVNNMRKTQAKFNTNLEQLKEKRSVYDNTTNEGDREFLSDIIKELETESVSIKKTLDEAAAQVRSAEMKFLSNGIIPPLPQDYSTTSSTHSEKKSYVFTKLSTGESPGIIIQKPKPQFDYSFKILPEAQFAENNTLPQGIVYQIQISVQSSKATIKSLKGLSPVFERLLPSKKYLYTVGLFYTHAEALSCLNQVRKRGFPKAFIVAFKDNNSINVKDARKLEKSNVADNSYQVMLKNYPSGIPSGIISAIKQSCDKDIAKSVIEGKNVYIVGPFAKKDDADYLVKILSGLGVEGISVELIKR